MMKKIKISAILLIFAIIAMVSCENADIEFDDFGITACYFPYQTPARTLILGKYDQGFNDNDNNHFFEIGVTLTGVYQNKQQRNVHFEVNESLFAGATNVKALPQQYYTIETESPVIIPEGDFKGRIKVQLTDAFFADTLAIAGLNMANYAIPLVIKSVDAIDSVLVGVPAVDNPKRVVLEDWEILPKDYTLFGIKYINKFHGNYLRRGADKLSIFDGTSFVESGTTVYHNEYVERDEIVKLSTVDLNGVTLENRIRRVEQADAGSINLKLEFTDNGSCTVFNADDKQQIGNGSFKEDGDEWGGKSKDVIYLEYAYEDFANNEKHEVNDTLVIRDRGVVFESFEVSFD